MLACYSDIQECAKIYFAYNFAYNFIATAEIYKKTKILNTVNIYTKNETAHQGASNSSVLEMQTTDREKFFNYFRNIEIIQRIL